MREEQGDMAPTVRGARSATRHATAETHELRTRLEELESEVRQLRRKLALSERAAARGERLQALGQLISGVTHELANPLTAVVACASFVSTATTLEDARRHAATIEEQGQRATKIVQTLSSFARRRAATRGAVSLNQVARAVVDLHGAQLAASAVQLVEELEPDLPAVEGDPYELEQVVLNLVMNAHYAIVHGHGRGRLVIRTRSTDDVVRLQVEDDGPGIPRADIPQVFEAFYTTKGENGTGLGLAISRDIMVNHHGRLWAESDEGAGTAMTMELPRLRSSAAAAPALDGVGLVSHGAILIVDDEPEFGQLLTELLRRRGYETEYVESAAAALGRLHERDFDIILTDLRMPKMSGEDLWQTLRRERPALAKRTVFMTGYYAARETVALVDGIEQPCLTKPFRAAELDELLATLDHPA
jgi:signal transduction histidine kinase/CheY-like chemotaxis protein